MLLLRDPCCGIYILIHIVIYLLRFPFIGPGERKLPLEEVLQAYPFLYLEIFLTQPWQRTLNSTILLIYFINPGKTS